MDISQYSDYDSRRLSAAKALMQPHDPKLDSKTPAQRKLETAQAALQDLQTSKTSSDPASSDPGSLFGTILDTVNPLEHIPGVSSVYDAVTGNTPNPVSSMAGGFLFGGPIGLAVGAANSFLQMITGKSALSNVMAMLSGAGGQATPSPTQTAMLPSGDPMFTPAPPVGLQQYQDFAKVQASLNKGTGAKSADVCLINNIWTQQNLKKAAGAYAANQQLFSQSNNRRESIA